MSVEVCQGVVEKLSQPSFREQAERKLPVGKDAVGVELTVELLQVAFKSLAGPDGVAIEFPIDVPEFMITDLAFSDGTVGKFQAVGLLLCDQYRFAFAQLRGLSVGQKVLGVVNHPPPARDQLAAVVHGNTVGATQREVECAREGHVWGRCDPKEICHQRVGHLVVLRASNAVNEQVGQEHSREQRC